MASFSPIIPMMPVNGTATVPNPTPSSEPQSQPSPPRSRPFNPLILFVGGASFFILSTFITRRQLIRRYRLSSPSFYGQSNAPPSTSVSGAMEAFEALNLATINVTSFAMMAIGGGLWAFDIQGMSDLRRRVRRAIGVADREDKAADEEMEEWLAMVIKRREGKEKRRDDERRGRSQKEGDEEMVGRILKALEEQGGKRGGRGEDDR